MNITILGIGGAKGRGSRLKVKVEIYEGNGERYEVRCFRSFAALRMTRWVVDGWSICSQTCLVGLFESVNISLSKRMTLLTLDCCKSGGLG